MATQHGRLREVYPESDTIKAYLEQVALYFAANDAASAKKVAILLSSIGTPTYWLLSDLVAPDSPSGKSFAEISAALRHHYEPKRMTITERSTFISGTRSPGKVSRKFRRKPRGCPP